MWPRQIVETKNIDISCFTPLFIVLFVSSPLVLKFNSDVTSPANCALSLFVILTTSLCSFLFSRAIISSVSSMIPLHISPYTLLIDTFVEFYFLEHVSNLLF